MVNEAWLFTFWHWTHSCDVNAVENYLKKYNVFVTEIIWRNDVCTGKTLFLNIVYRDKFEDNVVISVRFSFMELKSCTLELQKSNIIISTAKLLQTKQLCDLREKTELPITL